MHATMEAATKLSDRKKQKETTHYDDLPGAVEELERQLLVLKDQTSRAVSTRQPAQMLGPGHCAQTPAVWDGEPFYFNAYLDQSSHPVS